MSTIGHRQTEKKFQVIPDSVELTSFYVPTEVIERSGGFLVFDRLPKGAIKKINGKKAGGGFW